MSKSFTRLCQQFGLYLGVSVTVICHPALVSAAPVAVSPFATPGSDPLYYGPALCNNFDYKCVTIKHGDTWEKMFSDARERDLVQRVNRTYNRLTVGQTLVIPKSLSTATVLDLAPFPHKIIDTERQIIVDQDKLAWAAYNEEGQLVKWGPIASGRDKCSDSANSCRTLTGVYFHKGFALHGADDMPGFRASHGCVRLFTEDAKWLNQNFVETSDAANQHMGTKVVVRPVSAPSTFYVRRAAW